MTDGLPDCALERIDAYLASLSAQGLAAPAGIHWQRFFKLIIRDHERDDWPRNPLILGGAIASPEDKQERLREHLIWAAGRGGLEEALVALEVLPVECWHRL